MNLVFLGSLISGLSVAFGAFGAHALRERLEPRMLEVFQTGVQYQFLHGLALLLLAALSQGDPLRYRMSAICFLIGIVLFSGSLYALSLSGVRGFGAVTPLGGVLFLVGWGALAWTSIR